MRLISRGGFRTAALGAVVAASALAAAGPNYIAFVPAGFTPTAISADGTLAVGFMADGTNPPVPAKWSIGAAAASPITSQPGRCLAVAADDHTFLVNILGPGTSVFEILHGDGSVEVLSNPTIPGVTFTNQTTANHLSFIGDKASGWLRDSNGGFYSALWPEHVGVPTDGTPVTLTRGGDAASRQLIGLLFPPFHATTAARWSFDVGAGHWTRFLYAKQGTAYSSAATSMALDGHFAVGFSGIADSKGNFASSSAMKWANVDGSYVALTPFAVEPERAAACSADGKVVVGAGFTGNDPTRALFWDADGAPHDLRSDLIAAGVGGLTSTNLGSLIDVSEDGTMMLGFTAGNHAVGFVAHLQQPRHLRFAISGTPIVVGGMHSSGHVYIDSAATTNLSIEVESDLPAVQCTLPAVQIPAGEGAGLVPLETHGVDFPADAIIRLTYQDRSVVFVQKVLPAHVVRAVASLPSEPGGAGVGVTFYFDGVTGPAGRVVTIATDHHEVLSPVHTTVTMPPQTGFGTAALVSRGVDADTPVVITVSENGHSANANNTVLAGHLDTAHVYATPVIGGAHDAVRARLTALAGPSGRTLTVSCTSAAVVLPAPPNLIVAAQTMEGGLGFGTNGVDVETHVSILVQDGSISRSALLTLEPATIFSVVPSSNPVVAGNSLGVALHLNGLSGPSGSVSLTSSDPTHFPVPPTLPVGANVTEASFAVHTVAFTDSTMTEDVKITATYHGVATTGHVTLNKQ